MRKNCINKLGFWSLFLMISLFLLACKSEKEKHASHQQKDSSYTCPKHPQIVQDKPGKCPICGMDLVPQTTHGSTIDIDSSLSHLLKPVNEQVVANIPVIIPEKNSKVYTASVQGMITYDTRNSSSISSRVTGRIERQLIKYNYQPVTKGQLLMEIYSPDLTAAQRELIYLVKSKAEETLVQAARQRLSLLGMNASLIEKVINNGEPLYRIPIYSNASGYILEQTSQTNTSPSLINASSSARGADAGMGGMTEASSLPTSPASMKPVSSPVLLRVGQYISAGQTLFTIYNNKTLVAEFAFPPTLAATAKKGKNILYYHHNQTDKTYTGTIGLVQPVFKAGQNFTLVRVYGPAADFKVGEIITADIAITTNNHYWLPQSAVLDMGNHSLVFRKEENVFKPQTIKTGIKAKGWVEILDDITSWQIASNAYYLVDSESFIPTQENN